MKFDIPEGAIKVPVPDVSQESDYSCGASALQAICAYYGVGPEDEEDYVKIMKIGSGGADPHHIVRGVKELGLQWAPSEPVSLAQLKKYRNKPVMTLQTLKAFLNQGKPVMVMFQAWGSNKTYERIWDEGHWAVAIGYDRRGVYFEDPVPCSFRGFLPYREFVTRWHDVGPKNVRVYQYGIAIWKETGSTHPVHRLTQAKLIH